jgi:hypothetical protein
MWRLLWPPGSSTGGSAHRGGEVTYEGARDRDAIIIVVVSVYIEKAPLGDFGRGLFCIYPTYILGFQEWFTTLN